MRFRQEIRGLKGALLSGRNFPVGRPATTPVVVAAAATTTATATSAGAGVGEGEGEVIAGVRWIDR